MSGSTDTTARVWDTRRGSQVHCLRGHNGWLLGADFTADGQQVITHAADASGLPVRVWDVLTGACLQVSKWDAERPATFVPETGQYQWQARQEHLETVIERKSDAQPRAWFPIGLSSLRSRMASHPDDATWAGPAGSYVFLFTLEGAE